MPAPFRFDRRWTFPVTPADLWATVSRTREYPDWWNWLRDFDTDGAPEGLHEGASARCVIRAPLPYALRFTVEVEQVVEAELVDSRIRGDLEGPARLEIAPAGGGCTARLAWSLDLRDPVLRRFAVVGRPAMAWAHDRVVDVGVRQFEQRALAGRDRGA
ncbi:MAG TPA: SRPBCC family protein [Acidimicrobiia bacterium]